MDRHASNPMIAVLAHAQAECSPAAVDVSAHVPQQIRTIRAVERAFRVLATLASGPHRTVAQIARASGLPRTTTYRILRTLVDCEFASEWREHGVYGPGARVTALAAGVDPIARIVEQARPEARRLSARVRWPVSIAAVAGDEVVVWYTTDPEAALAVRPVAPGTRLPLLDSAVGHLHLAYARSEVRELLLERHFAAVQSDVDRAAADGSALDALRGELAAIRERGYAIHSRDERVTVRRSIAVPLFGRAGLEAALVVRFADRAVSTRALFTKLVAAARESGARISALRSGDPP